MPLYYAHPDGVLRRFGTNAASGSWGTPDTFVSRTTEPAALNTGPGTGSYANRPLNTGTDTINANVTLAAGETMSNKIINGYVDMTNTSSLINCRVRGNASPPTTVTGSRPLVRVTDHTVASGGSRAQIIHCDIEPQTPSPYWESCVGNRGYEVTRSRLAGTSDIFGVFGANSLGGYANIRVKDSFSPFMVFWQAASPGIVHPSDINTHNEFAQFQGNLGTVDDVVFDGNAIYARFDLTKGSTPTAPAEVPATVFACTCTPQGGSVPTQAAGAYRYNWLYRTVDRTLQDSVYIVNLGTIGSYDGNRVFEFTGNRVQRPLSGQKGIVMSVAVQGTSSGLYSENRYMDDNTLVPIQGG